MPSPKLTGAKRRMSDPQVFCFNYLNKTPTRAEPSSAYDNWNFFSVPPFRSFCLDFASCMLCAKCQDGSHQDAKSGNVVNCKCWTRHQVQKSWWERRGKGVCACCKTEVSFDLMLDSVRFPFPARRVVGLSPRPKTWDCLEGLDWSLVAGRGGFWCCCQPVNGPLWPVFADRQRETQNRAELLAGCKFSRFQPKPPPLAANAAYT